MRTQLECMEVCLAMDNEPTESLWVRTKEVTGMGDIIVGVSYRPPDQKEVDEALYRQLEAASRSQALSSISIGGKTQQDISNSGGS